VCLAVRAAPVVLTVARSEREGQLRQQVAREALAGRGLGADFDLLVGSEIRAVVLHVARWRACPLVILERQGCPSWWRWLRGGTTEWFLNRTEAQAFLAIPATAAALKSPAVVLQRSEPAARETSVPAAGLAQQVV
jgi:hypothetical protein